MTKGENQLIIATHNGMAIRIDENDIRPMSRSAHGVRAIKLKDNDYVVSMARVREGAAVLTVTEKGQGRRSELDSYRIQHRGGNGLKNYKVSDEKGHVCGIKVVDETDDIIMISDSGIVIRLRASDIRIMGRYATGVRLMRLDSDNKVVAFTRAEHDDTAEITEIEQPSEEELADEEQKAKTEENAEVLVEEIPDDE